MTDEYETLLGMSEVLQWNAADVYACGWSDTACKLYAKARALYAGAEALRRERESEERAAVVRWLRSGAAHFFSPDGLARSIERGEHRK